MKNASFRPIPECALIVACVFCTNSVMAQGKGKGGSNPPPPPPSPFHYRLEYGLSSDYPIILNDATVISDGTNSAILAVGRYRPAGARGRGFVYDQSSNLLVDAEAQFGLVNNYYVSSFQGISAGGIVVGAATDNDTNGNRKAVWFDLNQATPTLHFLEDQFLELGNIGEYYAKDVNNNGDILIKKIEPTPTGAYIANPFTGELITINNTRPVESINDSRVVIASWDSGTERIDAVTGTTDPFPDVDYVKDINRHGEFCGTIDVFWRKNQFNRYACRVDQQVDWISDPIEVSLGGIWSLDDDGDVAFKTYDYRTNTGYAWLYHEALGQSFELTTLVNNPGFNEIGTELSRLKVLNRDLSGGFPAPIICGALARSTPNSRLFFLFPEDNP